MIDQASQTSRSSHVDAAYPHLSEMGSRSGTGSRAIELFQYPAMPWEDGADEWRHAFAGVDMVAEELAEAGQKAAGMNAAHVSTPSPEMLSLEEEWTSRMAAESNKAEARGRSQGMEAGLAQGREEALHRLAAERERLYAQGASLAQSFAEERGHYFHQIEQETVRLALTIAARILRREAQMDPLLLTGAVRVALGQLAQSTSVRLRVPAQDQPLWAEALAAMPGLALRPAVIGEPGMQLGECRMETELGSADLGLWAQLKEIEHGFFDRVGARGAEAGELPHAASSPNGPKRPEYAATTSGSSAAGQDAASSGVNQGWGQGQTEASTDVSTEDAIDEAEGSPQAAGVGREW